MTMLDKLAEFADETSVAAAAGTAAVGSQYDIGTAGMDIGNGEPVYAVLTTGATEIITGGVAGTIVFSVVTDTATNLTTSPTTLLTSATFTTDDAAANSAALNAGGVLLVAALPAGVVYKRYLGITATIATTTVTAGTVNAFLTTDPSFYKAYANAI